MEKKSDSNIKPVTSETSAQSGLSFGKLLKQLEKRLLESDSGQESSEKSFIPPPPQPKLIILKWLKPLPWLLSAFFLFSFYWDFEGLQLEILGFTLPLEGFIRIVSVSGMIGFLTNWLAITMLFRPINKRPLLGQGLIPAQKDRIAYRLSLAVSEDLINSDIIRRKIEDSDVIKRYRERSVEQLVLAVKNDEFRDNLKQWLIETIQEFFENEKIRRDLSTDIAEDIEQHLLDKPIERAALKTYSIIKGKDLREFVESALDDIPFRVKGKLGYVDQLLDELPAKIEEGSEELDETVMNLIQTILNRFDIQKLVEENLQQYDEKKLESMIQNATNEQLKTIQYLGALLGTIGGLIIWQPVISLAVLSVLGGSAYVVDRVLYQ